MKIARSSSLSLSSIQKIILGFRPIMIGLLGVVVVSTGACQRKENIEAKKRLSSPAKTSPMLMRAKEKLAVGKMANDVGIQERVNRMQFSEVALRIQSGTLKSEGKLSFDRVGFKVRSAEKNIITQSQDGDFLVVNVTSDESRQELVYANDALFLKNNNGKWRVSRDPTGERIRLRNKSGGVWRSFYELFSQSLSFKNEGTEQLFGRRAHRYSLKVTDLSAEARQLGKDSPLPKVREELIDDAGIVSIIEKGPATMTRLSSWRKRARAKSGTGKVWYDDETGVVLKVEFKGSLIVGDEEEVATLDVDFHSTLTDIGKPVAVKAPATSTKEVARVRLPVKPREPFEKAGLVKPVVKAPKKANAKAKPDSEAQ